MPTLIRFGMLFLFSLLSKSRNDFLARKKIDEQCKLEVNLSKLTAL